MIAGHSLHLLGCLRTVRISDSALGDADLRHNVHCFRRSPTPASLASKASCRSARTRCSLRPLAGLAQNEELGCTGGEARGGGRVAQNETAIMAGNNRIMIF